MDSEKARLLHDSLVNTTVGKWKVGEYIDHGGSGLVAIATSDTETVALKIFDGDLNSEYDLATINAHIALQTRLIGHKARNLVKIKDAGMCRTTDRLFVAMEYVNGESLSSKLGKFGETQVVQIASQIREALRELESLGLAHGDLKPENVLIDRNNQAVLVDTERIRERNTSASSLGVNVPFKGTHRNSPPELISDISDGAKIDWDAVDLYQFGALMFEVISGRQMFYDETGITNLTDAIRTKSPATDLITSSSWHPFVSSCLLKSPSERKQQANLNQDFESFVGKPDEIVSSKANILTNKSQAKAKRDKPLNKISVRELLEDIQDLLDGIFLDPQYFGPRERAEIEETGDSATGQYSIANCTDSAKALVLYLTCRRISGALYQLTIDSEQFHHGQTSSINARHKILEQVCEKEGLLQKNVYEGPLVREYESFLLFP
jgi:serine/threonine protein kinase